MLVMVLALTTMRSANADGNELDKIDLSKIRAHEEDIIVRNSQFFVGCKNMSSGIAVMSNTHTQTYSLTHAHCLHRM